MRLRTQAAIIVFLVVLAHAVRINSPLLILPMFFFPPLLLYAQGLAYVLPLLTLWTLILIAVYLRRVWRKDASDTQPVYRWAVSVAAMALTGTIVAPYALHAIYPTFQVETHAKIQTPTTIVFEDSLDYGTCRSFCFMLEDFGVSTLVFASSRGFERTWTLRDDVCINEEKNPMQCWAPRDRLTETERAEAYIFRISDPQRRTDGHDRVVQDLTVSQNGALILTVTNTESNIRELVFGQSTHLWRRARGMDFMGVQEDKTKGYLRKERDNPQRPYTRNFFAYENQGLHHYALSELGLLDERSEDYATPGNREFRREMEQRLGMPRMTYDRFVGLWANWTTTASSIC